MDTDTLEFPPIAEPAAQPVATVETKQATLKETALASFAPIVAHMTTLAQRYRNVAFDLLTPKGMAAAKAARLELREDGRYAVQRLQKRLKDEANDLKRTIDAKAEEAIGIVKPVEDAIHEQIEARESQIAAEKAERDRIEAERKAKHESGIAKVRAYLSHCQQPGMTAARIQAGIDMLRAATFGPEWEEFAVPAANAQCETLDAMQRLHADAVAREEAAARAAEEAARIEAQRIENERIAAELEAKRIADEAAAAERQRVLDEQAADLKRQADELAAQRAATLAAEEASAQARLVEIEAALRRNVPAAPMEEALATAIGTGIAMVRGAEVFGANDIYLNTTSGAASHQSDGLDDIPSCPGCGAMAGCCSDFPNCPGGQPTTTSGAAPSGGVDHFPDAGEMVGGLELRTDQPTPIADSAAAADIANRVILVMDPEDEDDEGGIDANDLHMRSLEFVRGFLTAFAGKYPTQPKESPEWWAKRRAEAEALLPRLIATTGRSN